MTGFLLDTNILSALLREPAGPVARRIGAADPSQVCTSIIVAAELRFGIARKTSQRLADRTEGLLRRLRVCPFEPPVDEVYATLRVQLERTGRPIGANDLFIAAHALALDCTLVTDNMREFSRVEGLRIENWLR